MLLTDRSSGFLFDQHTQASKSTETSFFSQKGVPKIHVGRVKPSSEWGIKQCCTRERRFYAFTKLNLLFPLSLLFPVIHNYPRLAGFAQLAVHSTRLCEWSRLKGKVSPVSVSGIWLLGCPLFSLGGGSNCLQLRLLLPRSPWLAPEVQPHWIHRGILGILSSLMLTRMLVELSSGQPAVAGAATGKPSLLLLSVQVP